MASERRMVFSPKGLIKDLIDKLGPDDPRVIAEIQVRGHDAGEFVICPEDGDDGSIVSEE